MKKVMALIVVAGSLVILGSGGAYSKPAVAATKASIVLKAVAAWPTHLKIDYQYHQFVEELNKRAKDRGMPLTVEKTGGPDVIGPRQQIEAMRVGTVHMVFTAGGYFTGETIELSALACIKPEPTTQSKALRETKCLDVISEAARRKSGCIALWWPLTGGGFTLLSTKSVKGADWSGMKIRSFSKQTAMGITALGGSPSSVPAAEVYEALQRGIVDAIVGSIHDRWEWGERGVYKYIVKPSIFGSSAYWFMSAKAWDGLPSNVQAFIKEVSEDLQEQGFKWVKKWDDETLEKFINEDGVQVLRLSPEDTRKVAKAFRRDYLKWVAERSPDYGARLFKLLEPYIY
jgi:TRAP-type C4-dicarboxylate transport system substrate-binding protein